MADLFLSVKSAVLILLPPRLTAWCFPDEKVKYLFFSVLLTVNILFFSDGFMRLLS